MPISRLTQRRVDALKPHTKTCDIRDTDIKGFGIRILPSGRKRYFLHSQVDGKRVWHAIGDAEDIMLDHAARRQDPCWDRDGAVKIPRPVPLISRSRRWPKRSSTLPAALETVHAGGQSRILQESDPALVQGQADNRHHAPGYSAMVRLAPCHTGGGGPLGTGSLGDPQNRPRSTAIVPKAPIPVPVSSAIAGAAGSAPDRPRDAPAEPHS